MRKREKLKLLNGSSVITIASNDIRLANLIRLTEQHFFTLIWSIRKVGLGESWTELKFKRTDKEE